MRDGLSLFVQSEIAFTATFFSSRIHTWQTRESVGRFYKGSKKMTLFSAIRLVLRWPENQHEIGPKASSSGELLPCEEVLVEIKATSIPPLRKTVLFDSKWVGYGWMVNISLEPGTLLQISGQQKQTGAIGQGFAWQRLLGGGLALGVSKQDFQR